MGIIGRNANEFDAAEKPIQPCVAVAEDDHAISRVSARTPQEISLMAAQRRRQPVARAEKVDRAGLPVILGENCAARAFPRRDAVPCDCRFLYDFPPVKLVSVPLRQNCSLVRVFSDRQLEWQTIRIGDEAIRRKHWNHNGREEEAR